MQLNLLMGRQGYCFLFDHLLKYFHIVLGMLMDKTFNLHFGKFSKAWSTSSRLRLESHDKTRQSSYT